MPSSSTVTTSSTSRSPATDGYYLLGLALRALGRHDEALRAVESGIGKAPQWHDLFVLKSDILRDKKLPVDAMAAAKEAVRLDPDDPDTHTAVALSAAALKNHTLAVVALRRALALDPDSADLHRMLGDRLLDLTNHRRRSSNTTAPCGWRRTTLTRSTTSAARCRRRGGSRKRPRWRTSPPCCSIRR